MIVSKQKKLSKFVSQDLYKVHAVCSYRKTGKDTFPYMLCAFKSESSKTNGYSTITIPAQTWAISPLGTFYMG